MTFRVVIDTDSDAFQEDNLPYETARILWAVARRLDKGEDFSRAQALQDLNGNVVGWAAFEETP